MMEIMEQTDIFLRGADLGGEGPAWLCERRGEAAERFREQGLPTSRDEAWRFTNPKRITTLEPGTAREHASIDATTLEPVTTGARWVLSFVNGAFRRDLSRTDGLPEGLTISSLAESCEEDLSALMGPIPEDDAFGALNDAAWRDGALIRVAAGTHIEEPVQIVFNAHVDADTIAVHPRVLIALEADAALTLIESYHGDGSYLTNARTDVTLAERARLTHVLEQMESETACHLAHLRASVAANAVLDTHNVLIGSGLGRRELDVRFTGEEARADVNGLYLAHNDQILDLHLSMDHAEPHCESNQYVKGILNHKARGVFCGRVIVRQDAQKTDASQTNRNLLLSDTARVDTMPQLEIYADDVKCAHGATTGQIEDDALFYLQSRGLDRKAARDLLLFAFANEVVEKLPTEALRERATARLGERFSRAELEGETS